MYLGIDIGSSSSKAAILDPQGRLLAAEVVQRGTGTRGPEEVLARVLARAGLNRADLRRTVVTGYGRMTFAGADEQRTEIACHAKGVWHLSPAARTIVDVGGQDTKAIRLAPDGRVEDFVMNDKCAAGTGRFLEVMARVLDCPIGDLSDLARRGTDPVRISDLCTVFAESEVISHLAAGAARADVAAGAIASIAGRIAGMAARVQAVPPVVMTGGGARSAALAEALGRALDQPVTVLGDPQIAGALGAAVIAWEGDRERAD